MEEGRVQNLKFIEQMQEVGKLFDELSEEDYRKAGLAINILLYRRGVVDGSYEQDAELYRFLEVNRNLIDAYISVQGLTLAFDSAFRIAWVELKDDNELYVPFTKRPMNATQLILLAVLQKRFATKDSSQTIGIEDTSAVLLTENDIIKDMYVYMQDADDEGKKYDKAAAAINMFCSELGLLRLIWQDKELTDGSSSKVYRVSPVIGYKFDVNEMDRLIASVKEAQGGNDE